MPCETTHLTSSKQLYRFLRENQRQQALALIDLLLEVTSLFIFQIDFCFDKKYYICHWCKVGGSLVSINLGPEARARISTWKHHDRIQMVPGRTMI